MLSDQLLKEKISAVVSGLAALRDEGKFNEPNLDGSTGDYVSFDSWEWPQGVGLYGLAQLWLRTGDEESKTLLEDWYTKQLDQGLPKLNVNTTAPMLALSLLWGKTKEEKWFKPMDDWANAVLSMPRTEIGGFQHNVSDKINDNELWDDTLFMVALFLASYGEQSGRRELVDEAVFQFLVHTHYLCEPETGLWFHGWSFDGNHNFARARWARGNAWISAGVLDLLELADIGEGNKRFLIAVVTAQINTLMKYQAETGAWHTLIDDDSSYEEISATAAFGYAMMKGARLGIGPESWREAGLKALDAVLANIDENGTVQNVSYGTRMGHDLQFYKDIPLEPTAYGQSMALLCLVEALNHVK
ncbi:glycoside hydrolase family 88 protein [uncultured Cohaesibacter sp.]|uniref:beta-galactosidase BglB n=1 Tax=uncultured Cohaesibacter sp. TaxID=1002546 RepID=UPI002AA93F8B|nr:glycoside hydrolase family 88 protein [uncultured Cohaesibacter sp.]